MIVVAFLCLTLYLHRVLAQGECADFRGRVISHGLHYVPGPDTCTLCVCDNGIPKVCKAVLCSPPQDCRSFRVGNTCCEFICLDDVVKPAEGGEANLRVAAGGAVVMVLLTVAFVVYRVRKQKRRRPPHADDQRSLTSIGYISGSMGYMGGTCETALAAWKPPGNYLPRGEAPPPYDEVVAQCRSDAVRMGNETPFHRTFPSTLDALPRPEEVQCAGHGYANMQRPVQQVLLIQQMANTQNCYNAPLLQPVHPPEVREANPIPHHPLTANVIGFPSAIRLTGSLGAISGRGMLSVAREHEREQEREHERPRHVPGFYTNTNMHAELHRTIPRISTTSDTASLEACFSRDRALYAEVRRSFHRDTGRSMPRNLNLAERGPDPPLLDQSLVRLGSGRSPPRPRAPPAPLPATAPAALAPVPRPAPSPPPCRACAPPPPAPPPATPPAAIPPVPPHATLPLTVDKPSCVCSYAGAGAPGTEDADDYRSECENCKSASSSRWVVSEGWEDEAGDGTQTLQRRAPPAAPAAPASSTLPQPGTRPRAMVGPPSNWENWFNTIPDSDTESEEE